MDIDLRVSFAAAAAAALLSALVGAFSGVFFGALLLRALLGGAAFGGFTYGTLFLARRYVPGLAPGRTGAETAADASSETPIEEAHLVDIVLPGEQPEAAAGADPDELESVDSETGSELDDLLGPDEPATAREARGGRAVRRPATHGTSAHGAAHGAAEGATADDLGSFLDSAGPVVGGVALPRTGVGAPAAFEDLDVLPDLDGFSDTFAATEFSGVTESADAPGQRRPAVSSSARRADGLPESLDPASLAQAVRTILKRDQKG